MVEDSQTQYAVADPLLSNVELSLKARFFPLGFPVDIETNSSAVLDAAFSSWARFSERFAEAPVRLSIGVTPASGEGPPGPPVNRSRENLLTKISDDRNFLVCDFAGGFAFGWLTEDTVSDAAFFRYYFLEAAALTMLTQRYWAPVHGALIELDGQGVLLCGETFAGKSTLSYACARAGWTFISDDGTFLLRNGSTRYGIGNPHSLRLREDAPSLFPELAPWMAGIRANGKVAIEVPTAQLPGILTAPGSEIHHMVFLNRHGSGRTILQPYPDSDAFLWMQGYTHYGTAQVRKAQHDTYRRLLRSKIWELHYQDLNDAVARLSDVARHGS